MAITALNKVAPFWYTPEDERGLDNPTSFQLKPLTPPEKEACMSMEDGFLTIPLRNFEQVLKYGLVGWEAFADETGKALKFSRLHFDRIPEHIRMELAGEILRGASLSEDEVKN